MTAFCRSASLASTSPHHTDSKPAIVASSKLNFEIRFAKSAIVGCVPAWKRLWRKKVVPSVVKGEMTEEEVKSGKREK